MRLRTVSSFLHYCTGRKLLPQYQISRELKYLNWTRKVLTKRDARIDVERQIRWWNNPPIGEIGQAGCFGVPTELLIDTDEMHLSLVKCNPRYGHSQRGEKAIAKMYGKRGKPRTLIMSTNIIHGVVAYWLIPGGITKETWQIYLQLRLLPRLIYQSMFLMWDNLRAHITLDSYNTCNQAGHTALARPQHSPHFSWQEGVFSNIRNYLEEHYEELTEQNFDFFIFQAINQVTPDKISGYAIGAHYYIPGKEWQPWQGD